MTTLSLFPQADDSPLFSGTPMRAQAQAFDPQPQQETMPLFAPACRLCMDTGLVRLKVGKIVPCICKAGKENHE